MLDQTTNNQSATEQPGSGQQILDIGEHNLQSSLEYSRQQPILFYFWSARSQHCAPLTVILESLVSQYHGQFLLAKVNCDTEPMVAAQFAVRAVPTVYLVQNGQPLDGFQGPQPEEAIRAMLEKVLPRPEQLQAQQAAQLLAQGNATEALPLLKEARKLAPKDSEIALLLAQAQISLKRFDDASDVLQTLPIQDRDSRYQGLLAQIELEKQAADTPEIRQLQQQIINNPQDLKLVNSLALQLHQAGRDEESLALLLQHLQRDLNAADGQLRRLYQDILAALGTGDPLASKYRRQLYSLLY